VGLGDVEDIKLLYRGEYDSYAANKDGGNYTMGTFLVVYLYQAC
jgi:hypothetical protein